MNKRHLEKTVRWILYVMLMVTVLTALIALVDKRTGSETPAADEPVSEAPVGSFESTAFNEGWVMTEGGKDRTITLPYREASIHSKELNSDRCQCYPGYTQRYDTAIPRNGNRDDHPSVRGCL